MDSISDLVTWMVPIVNTTSSEGAVFAFPALKTAGAPFDAGFEGVSDCCAVMVQGRTLASRMIPIYFAPTLVLLFFIGPFLPCFALCFSQRAHKRKGRR